MPTSSPAAGSRKRASAEKRGAQQSGPESLPGRSFFEALRAYSALKIDSAEETSNLPPSSTLSFFTTPSSTTMA